MIKDLLMILGGIVAAIVFIYVRKKIIDAGKKKVLGENVPTLPQVETFNTDKLIKGLTDIKSPVSWAKTISLLFNARVLIIIGIIVGVIYGYGYYKGRLGKPVQFDLRGKEATVKLNEHYLKIERDGTANVVDEDGKVLKQIKVKDIPELRKAMRPYGLILNPVAVGGLGVSNASVGLEGGIGVRYLKWFDWYADICVTNKGFYPLGISYRITDNTAFGISVGTGYKENERGFLERWMAKITIKF